jgi:hypothetical protein
MTYKVRRMRDGLKYEVSEEVYRSRMSETPTKSAIIDLIWAAAALLIFVAALSFIIGD